MDDERNISEEAMQRGLDCLTLFAERLQGINPDAVRITGTYPCGQRLTPRYFWTEPGICYITP